MTPADQAALNARHIKVAMLVGWLDDMAIDLKLHPYTVECATVMLDMLRTCSQREWLAMATKAEVAMVGLDEQTATIEHFERRRLQALARAGVINVEGVEV